MLKRHIARVPLVVRRTVSLFEARVFLAHLHLALHHSSEVPSCENAVLRNNVVEGGRLELVKMRETGGIGVAQQEWHESVSIIDCVQLVTRHELL